MGLNNFSRVNTSDCGDETRMYFSPTICPCNRFAHEESTDWFRCSLEWISGSRLCVLVYDSDIALVRYHTQ